MKLPRWFWILAFLVCWPTLLFAQPLYSADAQGIHIVLTDEPCQLKTIANLPYRVIWTQDGKTYEGCFGARQDYEAVVAYFSDFSVALIPFNAFKKLTPV